MIGRFWVKKIIVSFYQRYVDRLNRLSYISVYTVLSTQVQNY